MVGILANRYSAGEGIKKNPQLGRAGGVTALSSLLAPPFSAEALICPAIKTCRSWLDRGWSSDCNSRRDCAGIPPDLLPY